LQLLCLVLCLVLREMLLWGWRWLGGLPSEWLGSNSDLINDGAGD